MIGVVLLILGLVVLGLLGQAIEDYLKGEDDLQVALMFLMSIMVFVLWFLFFWGWLKGILI